MRNPAAIAYSLTFLSWWRNILLPAAPALIPSSMASNTLVIVSGYGSIAPKRVKHAYLNISEETAHRRFLATYPGARDTRVISLLFEDELLISSLGELSSTYR